MSLRVFIQGREHDRENDFYIVTDKIAKVLVVPEVKRALRNLEVGTSDRLGQLIEKRLLHFRELGGVHNLEDILYLVQEHDLLCAIDFGPITQESKHNLRMLAYTRIALS
jgi:Trm5-related predicted tRNA methylase